MKIKALSFSRERRIRKSRAYQLVYAGGRRFHSAHYLLIVAWQGGEPQRLGIAASKKIGNAVARNRVKRALREIFRLNPFSLPGAQIIAIAKKGAADLGYWEALGELSPLLHRLAGIQPES